MQVQMTEFGSRGPIPMVPLRLIDDIKDNLIAPEEERGEEASNEEGAGEEEEE